MLPAHVARFPVKLGQPTRWFLCSDLHLGHVAADVPHLRRELERAADYGARILINGDVFDAVTTGDKRYTPGQTVHRIAKAKDALNATVELGFEVLKPFAPLIHVIGIGNHEEAWIKYRQSDPVRCLIDRLNAHLAESFSPHRIAHGGISGFIVSLFDIPSGKGKPLTITHRLKYHHGAGGDAPITGGLISANRTMVAWVADAYTSGHRHNRLERTYAVGQVRPNGRVYFTEPQYIATGSYLDNFPAQPRDGDPLQYTYAESADHPPKPKGGAFLVLTPERVRRGGKSLHWQIRQDRHSALMPA